MEEKPFEILTAALIGTNQDITEALLMNDLVIDIAEAEQLLEDGGFGRCPGCGFWSYITDEYCVDCEDEMSLLDLMEKS
jgi:hypothetical protein